MRTNTRKWEVSNGTAANRVGQRHEQYCDHRSRIGRGLLSYPERHKRRRRSIRDADAGAGAKGSTIGLLDGAINLGFAGIEKRLARPDLTLAGYVVALVGAYHTSVDTPRNLRRAAKRFEELGRPEVAAYLEVRAREETGHDRLALKDLRALGVPGERLVANFIPEGIAPLCKHFDDLCAEDYPIGCIGYSYCLERIAALKQKTDIEKVQALCPDADATRFLRSHSCLGSEVSHVEETIEFVASLPANDRISVVQETYRSALIMAEGYNHELLKSEAEILKELQQAVGEPLPSIARSCPSHGEKLDARPAA
jgi:pyrroloquinoline quinone (PQQ) biosynthesis protein C